MNDALIPHISDTARWVAVYRAWESARSDALFQDPFAERLAGARGQQIAASVRRIRGTSNGWPIIARTKLIDELVELSLEQGCDCVLNLAAGLDTRPYRLALPRELPWIEVDLPELLEEKERALAGDTPACRLQRVKLDLADPTARATLLDRVAASAKNVLVITEGLVIYLEDEAVRALSRDLLARASLRWWMLDLSSPAILAKLRARMGEQLANAPMKFAPANGVAYFEQLGWSVRNMPSLFHSAARWKRVPWPMRLFARFPPPDPRDPRDKPWGAVVRLERGTP